MNFDSFFEKHISLGYNCFIKKYFNSNKHLEDETQFFDYTGACMWTITELIQNKFENLFDKEKYKKLHINKVGDQFIITQIQYYLIFKHDFTQDYLPNKKFQVSDDVFFNFKEKYTRRIARFYKTLETTSSILFYRFGENLSNRIIHKQYQYKLLIPEYTQLITFVKLIRELYPLR